MATRRAFLKSGGVALVGFGIGSLGTGPAFLHRTALAAPGPNGLQRRKILVALFQRGAMDALMAVPPIDDKYLRRQRPNLALDAAGRSEQRRMIDLGDGYGFHPSLEPLRRFYDEGRLGVVHAVGSHDPTRSHFDAQDYMETATPGRKGTPSGWLNRVIGELGHEATSPFRAVSLTPTLPRSFYGEESALAVERLRDFRLQMPGAEGALRAATGNGFESLYEQTTQRLLSDTSAETFEAMDALAKLEVDRYRPEKSADYPSSALGDALRQIAFLIKAEVGLEVAFAESGGWDTHVRQGTTNGSFANRLRDLSSSIQAFWNDLGTYRDDVVLLTMTEFGRTVAENGSLGTDHGHGSCLFVLGHDVDGGKVHGDLPTLAPENLYESRDLPVTTDFRSVFTEVVARHLGVPGGESLFPGFAGPPIPLFRKA